MEIPRALQDYLGSGSDDAAPCILATLDGPIRTRAGGTRSVLQREDDDDGAAPADEAVNQEDGAPLLRVGAVVDASAAAFGETYVEQARNGSGPQKFRGMRQPHIGPSGTRSWLPRTRRGVVAGRVRVPRRARPRQRGALARRLERMDAVDDAKPKLECYSTT